ncbi:hypothetical protein C8R44DRAFT_876630 [Mycena epipterygia]|nr:hypothetical protein C8R44DRAFT_876630 [Mycena epipterygia]
MSFIILNAYPGVGKLTVAKQLASRIPSSKVFSNHLLIDVVAALHERDNPAYQPLRRALRQAIFDSLINTKRGGAHLDNIIFTESQATTSEPVMNEYLTASRTLGIPLFSIILDCTADENARRLVAGSRGSEDTKLTDVGILETIRNTEVIFKYGDQAAWEVRIDTSSTTADQVADAILAGLRGVRGL